MDKILKTTIILLLFLVELYAASFSNSFMLEKKEIDFNVEKALAYLNGRIGSKTIKRIVPDCPYERCKKPNNSVKHVDKKGGEKIFYVKIPDYKTGISILKKLVKKRNKKAAIALYNFLSKRVDYQSKNPNKFLINKMKRDTGLSYDEYLHLLKESLIIASEARCDLVKKLAYFDEELAKERKKTCKERKND